MLQNKLSSTLSYIAAVAAMLAFPLSASAQELRGKVVDCAHATNAIIGANVVWKGTSIGTATDATGNFVLQKQEAISPEIIVTYIGYTPYTIQVAWKDFVTIPLAASGSLKEVVVEGQQTRYSSLTPTNSQVITSRDLEKSACCNLAGRFVTNATVEVSTTDAVSGAKQIQMRGLDGSYTLLTTSLPALRELTTPYRLIPLRHLHPVHRHH